MCTCVPRAEQRFTVLAGLFLQENVNAAEKSIRNKDQPEARA